jgi:sugar-specific transcriptional regulator TrmB
VNVQINIKRTEVTVRMVVSLLSLSEMKLRRVKEKVVNLGLKKYQAAILTCAMLFGESTAARLGKVAKVPSARVYETISELRSMGLLKVRPGRPIICSPLSAEETVGRILRSRRIGLEEETKKIQDAGASVIKELNQVKSKLKVDSNRSPLVRLIDVGNVSEQETRRLYRKATKTLLVFSRAYEYLPRVIDDLAAAGSRKVAVKLILLDPSRLPPESVAVQQEMLALLRRKVPAAQIKFSSSVPLRGAIIDPNDDGAAMFLAEEKGVPLFVREAAVTENTGVVRALAMLFDLLWHALPA